MRILALALAISAMLAAAPVVHAQDVAQARALFERGLAAAHAQQWDDAAAAFRASLAIAERPSTLLNLAGAEVETGHFIDGAASYRRFLELAPARDPHRSEARAALAAAEARIAHVQIAIDGGQPGDQARIDDRTLLPAALASPVDVDPGTHTFAVVRDGDVVSTRSVEIADAAQTEVRLTVVAPVAVAAATDTSLGEEVLAPVTPAAQDDTPWIVLGVCLGVAVAAGVTVGVVLGTQPSAEQPYQGNVGVGVIRL